MKERFWENPEVKKLVLKLIGVWGVLLLLTIFCAVYFWANLHQQLINDNLRIIGQVVSKHPELKEDIVTAFSKQANQTDIIGGIEAAKEYGYDATYPLNGDALLSAFSTQSLFALGLIFTLYFLVLCAVFFWSLNQVFRQTNAIALAAERIVDGDFTSQFSGSGEGVLAKLEHQFNQMSRRLELSLHDLRQEKIYLRNMISDISHQLKTPISSLKVFNELLLEEDMDKSQAKEFLQRSGSQLERMEWLISNLLTLARIEAGAVEFNQEYLPLFLTVEEAVGALSINWQSKGQLINIQGDCQMSLSHDKRWLGEAIKNILKNSIEHTPEGGLIEIQLVDTPVVGRIIIKDKGKGIHKDDLPYIFQRFYQGKHNLQGRGTGIGLALAKSIIENQGGLITVKSEVGKGSEFVLSFVKGVV